MDELPEREISRELGPSEQLLWAGFPRQGVVLRAPDVLLVPFSIFIGGFVTFWFARVIEMGAPLLFMAFGVLFVLFSLYLIVGRFWVEARKRAATAYGVTSERVIIVSGVFSRNVKSLSIGTLTEVALSENADGGGTITFGPVPLMHWLFAGTGWPMNRWPWFSAQDVLRFDLPTGARGVYEIIRGAVRAAQTLAGTWQPSAWAC